MRRPYRSGAGRRGLPGRHVSATDAMTPRRRATLIVA